MWVRQSRGPSSVGWSTLCPWSRCRLMALRNLEDGRFRLRMQGGGHKVVIMSMWLPKCYHEQDVYATKVLP
eukprot:1159507-Pelagomonas_calceolata.AAC.4